MAAAADGEWQRRCQHLDAAGRRLSIRQPLQLQDGRRPKALRDGIGGQCSAAWHHYSSLPCSRLHPDNRAAPQQFWRDHYSTSVVYYVHGPRVKYDGDDLLPPQPHLQTFPGKLFVDPAQLVLHRHRHATMQHVLGRRRLAPHTALRMTASAGSTTGALQSASASCCCKTLVADISRVEANREGAPPRLGDGERAQAARFKAAAALASSRLALDIISRARPFFSVPRETIQNNSIHDQIGVPPKTVRGGLRCSRSRHLHLTCTSPAPHLHLTVACSSHPLVSCVCSIR